MSSSRKKDSKKDDEGIIFLGGKCFTRTNYAWWLLVFGVILLLLGLACLYILFNPPYLGYFAWLETRNIYLFLAAIFLLTGIASVLQFLYEKYIKGKSKLEK